MIELLSTETKPVYIGYNKLAADVAEATTDALTGADYIALQATLLSVFLQQHEGRPWLDVLLHAEEDSSYRGVLRAGRIPRYVGWRVWCAGRLI